MPKDPFRRLREREMRNTRSLCCGARFFLARGGIPHCHNCGRGYARSGVDLSHLQVADG